MGRPGGGIALAAALVVALAGCSSTAPDPPGDPGASGASPREAATLDEESGEITLAFAGDVHFQAHLRRLLRRPGAGLGPIAATLREADVAMLNLETAVTERGAGTPRSSRPPSDRYHFRHLARAFDVLAGAGVDVVSVANNHSGDYGAAGWPTRSGPPAARSRWSARAATRRRPSRRTA